MNIKEIKAMSASELSKTLKEKKETFQPSLSALHKPAR